MGLGWAKAFWVEDEHNRCNYNWGTKRYNSGVIKCLNHNSMTDEYTHCSGYFNNNQELV